MYYFTDMVFLKWLHHILLRMVAMIRGMWLFVQMARNTDDLSILDLHFVQQPWATNGPKSQTISMSRQTGDSNVIR